MLTYADGKAEGLANYTCVCVCVLVCMCRKLNVSVKSTQTV